MRLNNHDLSGESLFLKTQMTIYAFYGALIAGFSVVFAMLLVGYAIQGEVSLDGIMRWRPTI